MIKIELIKFEAQDVITVSGVAAPFTHSPLCTAAMTGGKDDGRDTHEKPGFQGYPNPVWLNDGLHWRNCDCECHK